MGSNVVDSLNVDHMPTGLCLAIHTSDFLRERSLITVNKYLAYKIQKNVSKRISIFSIPNYWATDHLIIPQLFLCNILICFNLKLNFIAQTPTRQ